jgi:hypothetical protein
MIGIPSDRIIKGTIAANTLIVSIKQVLLLDATILAMPAPCGPITIEALANLCNCSGIDGRELSSCNTNSSDGTLWGAIAWTP